MEKQQPVYYVPPPQYNNQPQQSAPPQYMSSAPPQYNNPPPQQYNTSMPAYPQPQPVRPGGCFERNQKNKPQSNSAGAGALIFLSGGMNIAFSLGYGFFPPGDSFQLRISWFIGGIIGSILSALLIDKLPKKILLFLASAFVMIGGILFCSLPDNYDALTAARYFDGIGNGLAIVPTLVLCGEQGVPVARGMLASSIEAMCLNIGIYLQIIIFFSWVETGTTYGANQVQGSLSIFYGVLCLIIAYFLMIDSPVYLLQHGREAEAIDALRKLQRPFIVTTETYEQFEEHKRYIADNRNMSFVQSFIASLPALLKLCIYRGLAAMTFSYLIKLAVDVSGILSQGIYTTWEFYIFGLMRWLGVFVSAFLVDSVGRKNLALFGALVSGGLLIGVGVIFDSLTNYSQGSEMESALWLLIISQLFAGIFITPSSAYLSEAFALTAKPLCIAIAFTAEMLTHIIILAVTLQNNTFLDYYHQFRDTLPVYHYVTGGMLLVFFVLGILILPETKRTPLREAQHKFRRLIATRND